MLGFAINNPSLIYLPPLAVIHFVLNYFGQRFQGLYLQIIKLTGLFIFYAESSDPLALAIVNRNAGVESDMGIIYHHWIVIESFILKRVFNYQNFFAQYCVTAKRYRPLPLPNFYFFNN